MNSLKNHQMPPLPVLRTKPSHHTFANPPPCDNQSENYTSATKDYQCSQRVFHLNNSYQDIPKPTLTPQFSSQNLGIQPYQPNMQQPNAFDTFNNPLQHLDHPIYQPSTDTQTLHSQPHFYNYPPSSTKNQQYTEPIDIERELEMLKNFDNNFTHKSEPTIVNQSSTSHLNREILSIAVDIGNGQQADLLIRENDDPQQVANEFAFLYGIEDHVRDILAQHIKHTMEQVIKQNETLNSQYLNTDSNPMISESRRGSKASQQLIPQHHDIREEDYSQKPSSTFEYPQYQQVSQYQRWKQDYEAQLMNQHQPQISNHSRQIVDTKYGSSKKPLIHERLHKEAIVKQKRQSSINQSQQNTCNTSRGSIQKSHNQSMGIVDRRQSVSTTSNSMCMDPMRELQALQLQTNQQDIYRQGSDSSRQQNTSRQNQSSASKNSINYGQKLYYQGIKKKHDLQRHLKQVKLQQDQETLEPYSFRPQINSNSKSMIQRDIPAEDSLLQKGLQAKQKIQQLRYEQVLQERLECQFKPQIAKYTDRILSARKQTPDTVRDESPLGKFGNLYEDAKRRKERHEKVYQAILESECTFVPDTSATKRYNARIENRDPNIMPLPSHREKSKEHQLNQINSELFDPETGQEYFKPKTGRPPRTYQRPDSSLIGDMLYNKAKEVKAKLEIKVQLQLEEEQKLSQRKLSQCQSDRIVGHIKNQRFKELFIKLDSDQDGVISAQKIDISNLSPEILEILTPLLCEMEGLNQSLSQDEFIDAATRLYDTLALPEKNTLLRQEKKSLTLNNELKFQPQLNPNSVRIASQNRQSSQDIYDRLVNKQQEYDLKLLEKMKQKDNLELNGCTFHPEIHQSQLPQQIEQSFKMGRPRTNSMVANHYPIYQNNFSSVESIQNPYQNFEQPYYSSRPSSSRARPQSAMKPQWK